MGGRGVDGLLEGLDGAQREAVTTDAAPLRILAGAGSGKTRVLTRRIAYRVATGQAAAERTMAVTFTRRAAAELRRRLRQLGIEGVQTGTLHSLAWARLQQRLVDQGRPVPRIIDNAVRGLTDEEKRRRGVIDFEDILVQFAEAVRTDAAFAEAVRWFTRHMYVDEFQDVTPAQFDAVNAWVGDRTDLTVVGDSRQSIYGWNGADPSLLQGLPFHTVELAANYRSTGPIVAAAARVLAIDPPLTHADGPAPTVTAYADERAEARGIARQARLARAPNTPWSHIAVLTRTNAYLDRIAEALSEAGIPFRFAGRDALLRRPSVKDALDRLPAAAPAKDAAAQLRSLAHDYVDPADVSALHDVADMAGEFDALCPGGSVAAFRAWLPTTKAGDGLGGADAVLLATFHKAKGLEWPTVFVAGVQDGLVPLSTSGDVEEERRLLYVAMTRAERTLHLSHAGALSPFLPSGGVEQQEPPVAIDVKAKLAELRRRLAETSAQAS